MLIQMKSPSCLPLSHLLETLQQEANYSELESGIQYINLEKEPDFHFKYSIAHFIRMKMTSTLMLSTYESQKNQAGRRGKLSKTRLT